MQTEKAKALNELMVNSMDFINETVNLKDITVLNNVDLSSFSDEFIFKSTYDDFIDEFKTNILLYKDFDLCFIYIANYLGKLNDTNFGYNINSMIITREVEVENLLKLKLNIQKYLREIKGFFIDVNETNSKIKTLFYKTLAENEKTRISENNSQPVRFNTRFDYNGLIAESSKCKSTKEKIIFITNRKFEFKKWILQNDFLNNETTEANGFNPIYYPNFEELCDLEINRLKKLLEYEKSFSEVTQITDMKPESETSPFKWNSTDTDFLELFAALYQNESIVRADGKALTRKEMLDYFQGVLGLQIKDVEGKLTKATNRKLNMTPYIDSIKSAFETYAKEKENKLESRK